MTLGILSRLFGLFRSDRSYFSNSCEVGIPYKWICFDLRPNLLFVGIPD
jgi:hypothetical protein